MMDTTPIRQPADADGREPDVFTDAKYDENLDGRSVVFGFLPCEGQ